MFKTILVCADGSEHAVKAVQQAALLAQQSDACVLLLHVNDEAKEMSPYVMPWQLESGEMPSEFNQAAEQEIILRKMAQWLETANIHYQFLRECGQPAASIVHVAERESVDLIVMGSRGLSALKSLFMGSVSDYVVHHAHCSVLIVR